MLHCVIMLTFLQNTRRGAALRQSGSGWQIRYFQIMGCAAETVRNCRPDCRLRRLNPSGCHFSGALLAEFKFSRHLLLYCNF